jgi:hypothetical protein
VPENLESLAMNIKKMGLFRCICVSSCDGYRRAKVNGVLVKLPYEQRDGSRVGHDGFACHLNGSRRVPLVSL